MQDFYWFVIFVAANSTILLLLTVNVSRLRIKQKVAWGDGDNKELMKAIRVHSNGTEQVPIYGLIILALTFVNASNVLLSSLVLLFTASRIIHAYGILYKSPLLRQIGAVITYATQGASVIALVVCINV